MEAGSEMIASRANHLPPATTGQLVDVVASATVTSSASRSPSLHSAVLSVAIESLAQDFSRRCGMRIRIYLDAFAALTGDLVCDAIHAIVQEALTNAARHSRAAAVCIDLRRHDDDLLLTVRDDGGGLHHARPRYDARCLHGIQQSAEAIGGWFDLDKVPDGGACLIVQVPTAWTETPRGTPRRVLVNAYTPPRSGLPVRDDLVGPARP